MPVLVVDDVRVNRLTLVRAIRPFPTVEAEDGAEALEILFRDRPEVVLLDLGLPGVDGVDVLRLIRMYDRRRGGLTPVVVVTGEGTADRVKSVAALNVQGFFIKPIDPPSLVEKIRSLWPGDAPDPGS